MKYYNILLLVLFLSCKTSENTSRQKIIGNWAIYEMSYNGKNCVDSLLINAISFQKDQKFLIPKIYTYVAEDDEDNTKWNLKGKNILELDCQNPIFKGSYNITFFKNHKIKGLGIRLKSKTTSIVAYKSLQNFAKDGINW